MKKIIFNILFFITFLPLFAFAQGVVTDPASSSTGVAPASTPADSSSTPAVSNSPSTDPASTTIPSSGATPVPVSNQQTPAAKPVSVIKTKPKAISTVAKPPVPVIISANSTIPQTSTSNNETERNLIITIFSVVGAAILTFLGFNIQKKNAKNNQNGKNCPNIKKLMEEKLEELTDLKSQLADLVKEKTIEKVKNITEDTKTSKIISFIENREEEYEKLQELYEKCITDLKKTKKILIFHGTEGYPEENWFPWMKEKLEAKGYSVIVPQFPTPPVVPAKISEWFEVIKKYEEYINEDTIIIGHSLGGAFTLKLLEKLKHPVQAVFFVGTAIGVKPILYYERDESFSNFSFDWENIKNKAKHFEVFHSDNDPYVGLGNGEKLAKELGVELTFIPNAGHFNKPAGYTTFPDLLKKVEEIL